MMEQFSKRPLVVNVIIIWLGLQTVAAGASLVFSLEPLHATNLSTPLSLLFASAIHLFLMWGLWTLRRWSYWLIIIASIGTLVDFGVSRNVYHIGEVIVSLGIVLFFVGSRQMRQTFGIASEAEDSGQIG